MSWHAAIVDEAHKLKNDASKTYQACSSIPTKLRYGLTGTVMQVTDFTQRHGHDWAKYHWHCGFSNLYVMDQHCLHSCEVMLKRARRCALHRLLCAEQLR